MRKALLSQKTFAQKISRYLHSESFVFPRNFGKIIQLTPDQHPKELPAEYLTRSLNEVKTLKREADERNFLTLIIRGTIMSPDPKIQEKTINLFVTSQSPPSLPKDVNASLTPGHISLYRHGLFISHLPTPPRNQEEALVLDVRRAIDDRHFSSVYIVQLNADAISGLDERLKTIKFKRYHLKPSDETDNCASAVSKILVPSEDLQLLNINPIAAAGQFITSIGATQLDTKSFDQLLAAMHQSGLSRSLYQVAADEALHRQKLVSSSQDALPASTEADTPAAAKDNDTNVNNMKGVK